MGRLGWMVALAVSLTACWPSLPPQESQTQPSDSPTPGQTLPPQPEPPAAPAESAAGDLDEQIVPGQRVGPITAQTSRADLVKLYGEAALTDAPIALGEGTTQAGTIVNSGSAEQFAVVWETGDRNRPELVKDFGPAWQTPEGLGVGTPFATLKAALGDFQLYGFAWDYGGTVVLKGTQLDRYDGHLLLRLAPAQTALEQHPEAYRAVMGDQLFSSDNPNLSQLELSIDEMGVYFDREP